nr:FRG domain-containing protein [uncultured Halomonas sp.]
MVEELHCDTAREFIELLSPLDERRWPRGEYVFRGQPCAGYVLAPAAHRTKGAFTAQQMWKTEDNVNSDNQVSFEITVLQKFLEACDASGISVPGDSPEVRQLLREPDYFYKRPEEWPPEGLFLVLATAQHHGAPTCLLDWTRRSYVAAYFAASGTLSAPDSIASECLAVWALRVAQHKNWNDLSFIEMPGGTSANLAAQAGVFTVTGINATRGCSFESTALERQPDALMRSPYGHPGLLKMTLPVEEAEQLLDLCADLGVMGSVLFPGYAGAARQVNDFANAKIRRRDR